MKKQYTKRQIQEAIDYWKEQLKKLNESSYGSSKTGALYSLSKLLNGPYIFHGFIDNAEKNANAVVTFDKFPSYDEIIDRFNLECEKKFGTGLYDRGDADFIVTVHFGGAYDDDRQARIYVAGDKDDADMMMKYASDGDVPICLVWPDTSKNVAEVWFAGKYLDTITG